MMPSCAGTDSRDCGVPMGMAQPGRGGVRDLGAAVEVDRWVKRALPPPPLGTGGPAMSNLPALHRTDNKSKVGCAYQRLAGKASFCAAFVYACMRPLMCHKSYVR